MMRHFTCLAFFCSALFANPLLADESIEVTGVVIALAEQAEVPAAESGVLVSIDVTEGDLVQAGQTLARIDDADARLALQRAEIERDMAQRQADNTVAFRLAQKSLELAENELARGTKSRELFAKAITDEELSRRKLAVDRARLEREQAQHDQTLAADRLRFSQNEIAAARNLVARRQLVAPIAGVVVAVHRRRGEWVRPGDTVVRVVGLDHLRAEGFISARQAQGLSAGRNVTLQLAADPVRPNEKPADDETSRFAGTLRFVSPEVHPVDGTVRVWAEFDNRKRRLRPGQRATLTIERASSIPAIPKSAPHE